MYWSPRWKDIAVIVVLIFVTTMYYLVKKQYQTFRNYGIKYPEPMFLFGNMYKLVTLKVHINELITDFYKQFEGEKYFGLFFCLKPVIVVRDIELVKKIFVKDFDHFVDHYDIASEKDPLFYHSLLLLKGEKWRQMRNTLTPAFTGSKMREMMYLVDECVEKLIKYLTNKTSGTQIHVEETKSILSKCTTDVIASCAFGIECDTLNNPDNQFYVTSNNLTQTKPLIGMLGQLVVYNPLVAKLLNIKVIEEKIERFYRNIVISMIKERSKTGLIRRDMIHLLMLAMSGKLVDNVKLDESSSVTHLLEENIVKLSEKRSWSDDEITAQAVFFIFAGLDTMATMLSFMCYELALNKDVQEKLREEVDNYLVEHNNQTKNIDLKKLTYMDMVMSETLRLWPPVGTNDRMCTKDYTLPPSNHSNKEIKIKKGQVIWIPTISIQRDPLHFPEPDKFIPERFSDENKHSIDPSTYLPFGIGPRSCIGNRFALMEAKIMMFNLIANFEIVRVDETSVPAEIIPHVFNVNVKNGLHLGFKRRNLATVE